MTQRAIDGPYIYFVTTNTTFRLEVFGVPEYATIMGKLIQQTCIEFGFELFAYCIMPDHVHMLVKKSGSVTVSRLMKHIKGRFWRVISGGSGNRIWQPRFNFRIVDNEEYFSNVIQYIIHNYQKAKIEDHYGKAPFVFVDWKQIHDMFE